MVILKPKRECSIRKAVNGYVVTADGTEHVFTQFYEVSEYVNDYLDPVDLTETVKEGLSGIEEYQTTVNQIKLDIDRSA